MKDKIVPYIVPVISLGLSFVLVTSIVIPKYRGVSDLRKEREVAKNQLNLMKSKTEKLSRLFASTEILRSDDNLLTKALPEAEDVPTLMNQVQKISDESGVTIQNLQFSRGGASPPGAESLARGVVLSLSVAGNFSTVHTFLRNLENSSRILNISTITIASREGELTANTSLHSYYYVPAGVESVEEPVVLDLNDPAFGKLIAQIKELKFYETKVDVESGIGKEDPFRR